MKRIILTVFIAASVCISALADDIRTVEGEATFLGDSRHSPADCKRLAAEQARIDALRKAFGTIVSQDILQTDAIKGDSESSRFLSLSSSETKGEWLGDLGQPEYDARLDNDGNYIVHCKIRGRAKEISNQASEFDALVLRNGTNRRNADTHFRHNDDLYLYFSAPVSGYVAAFLADESGNVYGILPYSTGDVDRIQVKRGYDYIFFDPSRGNDFGNVDQLQLTASDGEEFNKVYVVFSPEPFAMAPVKFTVPGAPPSMESEEFTKWLTKCRRNDPRMGVKSMNIVISPSSSKTETINY